MLRAAARRFLVMLVVLAGPTAAVSAALGALGGASVTRAISVGFYLVGSFLIVAGFFFGNRGPVRLKGDGAAPIFGSRVVRWATPEERETSINDSAIFVSLGFVLILLGVAADSRSGLY
jgi:hypothetical protein